MKRSPAGAGRVHAASRRWLATLLPFLLAVPVATGCSDSVPPTGPPGFPSGRVALTLALEDDVPTFKVDGRVRLVWEFADQPVGGRDLGVVVLPAGERRATFEIDLPTRLGRLIGREETVSPRVPFLCGSTGVFDPRETGAVTLRLELCLSEAE